MLKRRLKRFALSEGVLATSPSVKKRRKGKKTEIVGDDFEKKKTDSFISRRDIDVNSIHFNERTLSPSNNITSMVPSKQN